MDFETLDKIADSYIPILAGVLFGAVVFRAARSPHERAGLIRVLVFFAGMLVVSYGIMLLDRSAHLWESVGLDYSAHAAVGLTFVLSLCALARKFWIVAVGSYVLYALLMVHQKYHSPADLVSTVIPIAMAGFLLGRRLFFGGQKRAQAE